MIHFFKKLSVKLSIVLFAVLMITPFTVHAQAANFVGNLIQDRSEKIQDTFQQALFAATKSDVVDDMSALLPLMGFLMLVNIFSTLYKSGADKLLIEMSKMAFWALIAGGIMGGATYKSLGTASMFSVHKNICGTEFNYDGGVSLDRDVFNFMKYSADDFACTLYNGNVNHQYNLAVSNMFSILTDFRKFPTKCMAIAGTAGSGGDTQAILDCVKQLQQNPETMKDKCGTGITAAACYLAQIVGMISSFGITAVVDLFLMLIQIAVQTIQFIMMFAMIIGVGGSLLMLKLISPFLVMENVRGRVLQACKVPLAVAFFGFTQKTLLYFITGLMNAVTTAALICFAKFASGGDVDGLVVVYLMVAMACLALMAMQIVVILKVPKFSLMIVNLSLHELVNIGGEMLKAGFGMSTAAGFAIATGGASSIAGAASAAGKMGTQAASQGASWLGSKIGGAGSMMGIAPTGAGSPPNPSGKSPFVNRGGRNLADNYETKSSARPPRQQEDSSPINQNTGGGSKVTGPTGDNGILKKKTGPKKKIQEILPKDAIESERDSIFSDNVTKKSAQTDIEPDQGSIFAPTNYETANIPAIVKDSKIPDSIIDSKPLDKPRGTVSVPAFTELTANGGLVNPITGSQFSSETQKPKDSGPAGSPQKSNSRERRNTPAMSARSSRSTMTSTTDVEKTALSKSDTFSEYQETKDRYDKNDSPSTKTKKKAEDAIYGTFGSKQGRKELAKGLALGGARIVKSLIMDSLGGPGQEISAGILMAGNADVGEAFNKGQERYGEFRELVEGEERKRAKSAESGLDSANVTEGMTNSIMSDEEYEEMMINLGGVITGILDSKTQDQILRKMEAGVAGPDISKHEMLHEKYQEALEANEDFKASQFRIEENSTKFIDVLNFMVQKRSLSNEDVKSMNEVLTLPVNKRASQVFTSLKPRIEILMRAELLKSTNVKVKK